MATIAGLMSQTSSYETFVSQLVELESQKMFRMEAERSEVSSQKKALGAVSGAISDLENIIKEYENTSNTPFEPFSFSSSDDKTVEVNSASGFNYESDFNITVDRLASNDLALGQVRTGADTDLAAFGDGEVTITIGEKTETINIATTKDDGSGGTVDMTNEEILQAFADEIETLFEDEARASVFQVNDTEVQFSVQSLATGYDNRIQISGATGVLAEITDNVTRLTPQDELDAQFTIDGVTFERSENTIDDAIEGLSFSLKKATGEQETMSIRRDIDTAKSNVEDFIDKFNELNETIRERTFINPDSGNKGPLQGMRSVRNLSLTLRQSALLGLSSVEEGQISKLSEMGIGFENDGTMKIEDEDLLEEILTDRPEEISNYFTAEDSPIQTIKSQLLSYTEDDGIMDALEEGVDLKMERLDKRIEKEEKYLSEYEEKQRLIFNQLDLLLEQGQAQFDSVVNSLYSYSY
jgi:flagellar hook-associated protein 2